MRNETQAEYVQPTVNPDRLLRIKQVLEIFPVSRTTWWDGVKTGRYPKGIKLGERTTAWRASEIDALIDRLADERRA